MAWQVLLFGKFRLCSCLVLFLVLVLNIVATVAVVVVLTVGLQLLFNCRDDENPYQRTDALHCRSRATETQDDVGDNNQWQTKCRSKSRAGEQQGNERTRAGAVGEGTSSIPSRGRGFHLECNDTVCKPNAGGHGTLTLVPIDL